MKHPLFTTFVLLFIFLCTQIVGLSITSQYIQDESLYIIEPPTMEQQNLSFIPIIAAILIGTVLILILAYYKLYWLWTIWFGLSIFIAMLFALYPLYNKLFTPVADVHLLLFVAFAALVAILKVLWKNPLYQTATELFIYGGIIALFFPLVNVFSAVVLLILISIYDMYAVWKSKHMITLANFQTDAKTFAGISLAAPAKKQSGKSVKGNGSSGSYTAILGGGDIAFPLLFSTALLKLPQVTFNHVMITTVGAAAGLLFLFLISKPGRFYPAMPFITAGCLLGGAIVWLLI